MKILKRFFKRIISYIKYISLKGAKPISLGKILEKQAKNHPNKPLILFENNTITYSEFNSEANKISHTFLKHGYTKGDTVALFISNRPSFLFIHAGLAKIGVVPALLNCNLKGDILTHAIKIADAKGIIVENNLLEEIEKIKNSIPKNIEIFIDGKSTTEPQNEYINLVQIVKNQSTENPKITYTITSKDTLEYIYTSGTTGYPKATALRHQKWIQLAYALGGVAMRAISNDTMYCCLPLYHNSGINIAWSTAVIHGCTFALRKKFSAKEFWKDIKKYNANLFIYVGELCRYLYNQPQKPGDSNNPLKTILGNGLRGDYWKGFQKRFGINKIIEVYGATEGVGGLINMKGIPGMIGKLTVAGIRLGEVVRYDNQTNSFIKNKKGFFEKCIPGEQGMFLAKISPTSPFVGYKANQKATNEKLLCDVLKKGDYYFISGDIFKLHKSDYVSFVDRLGDTFKWKGEVVATNEVTDIINGFGEFEDVNVYGVIVPNTEGRAGMAAIKLLDNYKFKPNDLATYVIDSLPKYAYPMFIRIVDSISATESFKQKKFTLQNEGFNPIIIQEDLYFLDVNLKKYIRLTKDLFTKIQIGLIKV